MNKSILSFKRIIDDTTNINSCIKALNLNLDSCFLCFIKLIEDAIFNYDSANDYSYLLKVSNYLERVYQKLSYKKQKEYRDLIYKMRKIYKRQIQNIDVIDRKIFERVCCNLNVIITELIEHEIVLKEDLNRCEQNEEYIITIDDSDSKVLDDGLSIKKLENGHILLKVHIADPLVLYPYESEVMKKAKLKGETIYLEDDSIPMLPDDLSYDKLSLLQDRNRYTKTFCYEFDPHGNIVNYYFLNSTIRVNRRLTYDDMNELYEKGGKSKIEDENLANYDLIVNYLKTMFRDIRVYEDNKIREIFRSAKISNFAENLVSYSMILTGYMTAKYMSEFGYPYMYRCNKIKKIDEKIIALMSKDEILKLEQFLMRSFYTKDNIGHEKLNVPMYSHITSPLRRFSDVLNMHSLDICYFNKPTDKDIYDLEKEIVDTSNYINSQNHKLEEEIAKKLVK